VARGNQDQRVGDEERASITELIRRRQQAELVGVVGRLDAPCINDDVLRGRRERDDERERPDSGQAEVQLEGSCPRLATNTPGCCR
jgi:hypothetical protein